VTLERRSLLATPTVRTSGTRLVLSGVAVRYGQESSLMQDPSGGTFVERIMRGALANALRGDVLAFDEHDVVRYLGRTANGTLRLFDTRTELRYELELPKTSVGEDVAFRVAQGLIKGSSIGFRAAPGGAQWSRSKTGHRLRTVTDVELLRDVSTVVSPAYGNTPPVVDVRDGDREKPHRRRLIRRPAHWFV
jgi:uncharacterized protein